ncbi:MAG TPA: response regulator transcription factor [Solirubrobacteraceae bacterium]|nr:response regulator transcription factor [Solirubrobacteraceae bacterium]
MASCLRELPMVAGVDGVSDPEEAWDHPGLARADLVMVDVETPDPSCVISRLRNEEGRHVLATAARWQHQDLLAAMSAGASGAVCKDGLTPEALAAQVRAALHGSGVVPTEMLFSLIERPNGADGAANVPRIMTGLTSREQVVLRLIADGRLTREVAQELCYSERTVKVILSNAVNKLGARSRSQAVAHAVREGLI